MMTFLEDIADKLLKKFPNKMEKIALVLPSKRAVVFLKNHLSKKIEKPIFLPEFYSIEEFIEELSGLTVLDNISLQFILYETYLMHPPKNKESFSDFLKWSNMLLQDFNDIDRNLVDAKSIYTSLCQVKELENWRTDEWSFLNKKLTEMQSQYLDFFQAIYTWYKKFRVLLLNQNIAYQGLAHRKAVENIENYNFKWEKVWFIGLNALTKSEKVILDNLKQKDIARVFWDADEFYFSNPLHEAGHFLREQSKKWNEIDFKGVGKYYSIKKENFNIISCPKNISQAKVVSQILQTYKKEELENSETAIVLADEMLLYPVLHNLPSVVKQLNVTMGSPLKITPLFSFVESVFNLQINVKKFKREEFYFKDLISVIDHPYFSQIFDKNQTDQFKKLVTNKNLIYIKEEKVNKHFSNKFIIKLFSIWNDCDDAIDFLNELIDTLKYLIIEEKATIDSEILSTFYKKVTTLQSLMENNAFVSDLETLQIIILQLVSNEIIPFKGEPLKGVQLMGILETRTLDFKNLIILSVNEGKLPKGKTINSFIPYDIKKYFKLPTYNEGDAVFSYHFYRLLQRAMNISLIYNSETDDFGSGERSRFITQLLSEYDGDISEYIYDGPDFMNKNKNEIVIKNSFLKDSIISWASKGVSPSALNLYNNCSLHFYYKYLAKIRTESEIDEFADESMIGLVIHDALDLNYPIGIISDSYIESIRKSIMNDIEFNFNQIISKDLMKEGKNYLSLKVAQRLTSNFLDLEKKLILSAKKNNQKIKIIGKEIELFHNILVDGIKFKLYGKIDRIDMIVSNIRIIDYKTGNVNISDLTFTDFNELIENPKKSKIFQLLMYSYLVIKNNPKYLEHEVIAGNFSFKNLNEGLIKIRRKSKKLEVLKISQLIVDEFENLLKILLSKIINKKYEINKNAKYGELHESIYRNLY